MAAVGIEVETDSERVRATRKSILDLLALSAENGWQFDATASDGGSAAKSYLGGTPENGYIYDYDHPIRILEQSDRGDEESKVFVQSGGKDLPSPVHLRKNESGQWKLFNVSSLATGVRKPRSKDV